MENAKNWEIANDNKKLLTYFKNDITIKKEKI